MKRTGLASALACTFLLALAVVPAALLCSCQTAGRADRTDLPAGEPRWWRGNIHTHTRWSDGADYPEMMALWYKSHGYNFVIMTDHNVLPAGDKWALMTKPKDPAHLEEYRAWLGGTKPEMREQTDPKTGKKVPAVHLKTLAQFRGMFDEPGRFLLIQGEEITDKCGKVQVHVVAANVTDFIPPRKGASVKETVANDIAAVLKQESRKKRPMLAVLAHPNWGGVVPVEDFQALPDVRFFEVMNKTIAAADNDGDGKRLSTDRLWDVALAARLSRLGLGVLYAVAVDDTHDCDPKGGKAWVMVRSRALTPEALLAAMKAGDFYATTGVALREISRIGNQVAVEVEPEPGATYTIQFIGTLAGYDRAGEDAVDASGKLLPPTERYSGDIGKVLKEVSGASAAYTMTGKELYVRVKVVSSTLRDDPDDPDACEFQCAWTQPFLP
jgi:hypothetical protein